MSTPSAIPALADAVNTFTNEFRRILLAVASGALPEPSELPTINTKQAKAMGIGSQTFNSIVRERVLAGDKRFAMPRARVYLATPEGLSEALATRSKASAEDAS